MNLHLVLFGSALLLVAKSAVGAEHNPVSESKPNTLTEAEGKAGWKLLFNGRNMDGWHNFKTNTIRPGWAVKDGALVCADPHNAGDLCTEDRFGAFDLQLEYNISPGGNSGSQAQGRFTQGPSIDGKGEFTLRPAQPLGQEPKLGPPEPRTHAQIEEMQNPGNPSADSLIDKVKGALS